MSTNEKISKGDLELYCLDVLSQEERNKVEKDLLQEEYETEKQEIEKAIEFFAEKNSIAVNPRLRENILNQINETIDTSEKKEAVRFSYPMAAVITIALLSSILSVFYWSKWQSTAEHLAAINQEKSVMAESFQFANQKLSNAQESIAILTDPNFKTVSLTGNYESETFNSTIHWNPVSQETYLNIGNLKRLAKNQQYQLWSIQNGQPVDAGLIDLQTSGYLHKMQNNASAEAFAITIEPLGGSQSPTLEQLIVIGTI